MAFPSILRPVTFPLTYAKSLLLSIGLLLSSPATVFAQIPASTTPITPTPIASPLPPELVNSSGVLQRWREEIPDVWESIHQDPSFRTRWRLGYSQFPEAEGESGWTVGVEDLWVGDTALTVSGSYHSNFSGDRQTWGTDLRYYVLPLGSYVNLAPVLGYRNLEVDDHNFDGISVGMRLLLVLSRSGAADLSLTQAFVFSGDQQEVGITTLSVGYAITDNLRLSSDIEWQNSPSAQENRLGIILEWIP